jgi:GT2 family glycosyltransferase
MGRILQLANDLNGSAVVKVVRQELARLRDLGNRVTGGGFRQMAKRATLKLLRTGTRQPSLKAAGRRALRSFPAGIPAAIAGSEEALGVVEPAKPNDKSSRVDEGPPYSRWVEANDTISDLDRLLIRTHIAGLPYRPVISVIITVNRHSESVLLESSNSVITQIYPYWELCLAFDGAAGPRRSVFFRDWAARDPRIRLAELGTSGGNAALTNAALKMATGEFVTFLRNGDRMPEHALYEVALALGRGERPDIVYSDHDYLDAQGRRSNPWFKPGWDPDLILTQDYFSDFAVYRRTLVEQIGFLRPSFEGAEYYDLALRGTAVTPAKHIFHIPAILLHRQEQNRFNSAADAPERFAINATRRAVRDCLDSRGDSETHIDQTKSGLRVTWPLPAPEPLVSIIVPTRDRIDLLAQCVEGVLRQTGYSNLELLVVDNKSAEEATLTFLERLCREDKRVRILHYPAPFNYSAMNNAAAREAGGEVLLFLNNDIRVIDPGWLREMVAQALRPDVGIVGAKLYYANYQLQHGGVVLGPDGYMSHVHHRAARRDPGYFGQLVHVRTLSAVTAACAAIRRSVFFEVDGFDEINLAVAYNDIDLCLRLGDHGYRVLWTPFAELFHLESASRGKEDADPVTQARFLHEWQHMKEKWGSMLESADPFHNPNLVLHPTCLQAPSSPRREKPWRRLASNLSDLQNCFFDSGGFS